jgi:hypothetical protein
MDEIDKELIDPSVEPASEKAHRLTRASLAAVPALGGTLVEAFNALIEPPMARRKTAWMVQVTEALNELFQKGVLTEDDLQNNEKFFTTLVHASSVAIKNHEQEKLEALKNAVVNSALPGAPDDTLQQLFLNLVDSCTSWHLALLKLFQGPENWAAEKNHQFPSWSMGGLTAVIESAYPELRAHKDLYRLVWQELYRNGLVNTDGLGTTMSATGMMAKQTTEIGDQFLAFISAPTAQAQNKQL